MRAPATTCAMFAAILLWVIGLGGCADSDTRAEQPGEAETGSPTSAADGPAAQVRTVGADEETSAGEETPGEKKAEKPERKPPTHEHPAFKERVDERREMVRRQVERRAVKDKAVLEAMRTVPRHAFVPEKRRRRAYADTPLPIGLGQTISQPYIVGYMTEKLRLDEKDRVLEVGTGSGYQAAVCAEIAFKVWTIEILEPLGKAAGKRLEKLGYRNVETRVADGYYGWEEHAPYDAIIVTAAAAQVPPPLVKQLKPGGRMVIPVGGPFATQYLNLVTKDKEGEVSSKSLLPVRFVPFTRKKGEGDE